MAERLHYGRVEHPICDCTRSSVRRAGALENQPPKESVMNTSLLPGITLVAMACLAAPAIATADGRYSNAPHPYTVVHITRHIMRDGSTAEHVRTIGLTSAAARRLRPAGARGSRRTASGHVISHNTDGSVVPDQLHDQIRVGTEVLTARRDSESSNGDRIARTDSSRTTAYPGGPIDAALVTRDNRPVRTELFRTDPVRPIDDHGRVTNQRSAVHITVIERPNAGRAADGHVIPTLRDLSNGNGGELNDRLARLRRADEVRQEHERPR